MLSRVDPRVQKPQALCICPTRELVMQNVSVLSRMAKYSGIDCTDTATAGVGRIPVITNQVVIGTIGKIKNWIANRSLLTKCAPRSGRPRSVSAVKNGAAPVCTPCLPVRLAQWHMARLLQPQPYALTPSLFLRPTPGTCAS